MVNVFLHLCRTYSMTFRHLKKNEYFFFLILIYLYISYTLFLFLF